MLAVIGHRVAVRRYLSQIQRPGQQTLERGIAMKLPGSVDAIRRRLRPPPRRNLRNALKITAGAGAAILLALKFRRELYGPGGTRMARYDTSIDKIWDKNDRRRPD
jgi:hypothetical protein